MREDATASVYLYHCLYVYHSWHEVLHTVPALLLSNVLKTAVLLMPQPTE